MRSDMLKNNYSHIEKAIELIEKGICEKLKPTEISKKLEAELMLSYKYFNEVFNATTGYTLGQYVRRRALSVTYERWRNEQPVLCKTAVYEGYPRFPEAFYAEFDITIEEAAEKGYTESQLQSKLDITNHTEILEALDRIKGTKLIKDYSFKNKQEITVEFDIGELLLFYLQMKVYLLPGACYKQYKCANNEERALFVIAFEQLALGLNRGNKFETSYGECEDMQYRLLNYDYDHVGGLLIVKPKMNETLKSTFIEKCDEWVPYIFSVLPGKMIPHILAKKLSIIEECNHIDEMAKRLNLSHEKTRELLWKYLTQGYLRVDIIE